MKADRYNALAQVGCEIQRSINQLTKQPSEITRPTFEPVLPHSLFSNTRGYVEKVVYQVNRTYNDTSYDACAVMIRRLIEILIIEAFEFHEIASKIESSTSGYLRLQDLITAALSEKSWKLSPNTDKRLRKLKTIGDQSAHSRQYNARRQYIDDVIIDVRTVSEELLYIAGLRK